MQLEALELSEQVQATCAASFGPATTQFGDISPITKLKNMHNRVHSIYPYFGNAESATAVRLLFTSSKAITCSCDTGVAILAANNVILISFAHKTPKDIQFCWFSGRTEYKKHPHGRLE